MWSTPLIRSFASTVEAKEEAMHPLLSYSFAKEHIDDLHREAARWRLARTIRRRRGSRSEAPSVTLQEAPAH